MTRPTPPPSSPVPATGRLPPTARTWTSDELFQGFREVRILHAGTVYRLRLTRQSRLILTK